MSKQKNANRKKQKTKTRMVLSILLILSLIVGWFYYKEKIYFYYAMYFNRFEHKNLKNSKKEEQRIDRIVGEYADKVFGLDISHYQNPKDIVWDSLSIGNRTVPIRFVVLRSTMGEKNKDRHFKSYWKSVKKHHLIRGAYHFYRPNEDPVRQANNFLETVKLESGDLLPILDIEKFPTKISKQQLKENLKIWLKIVEEKYGKKPIIYTYYYFYKDYLRGEFDDYPLWLANYNNVLIPSAEDDWKIWQFTENGIVYGINTKVDLNVYNGNIYSFNQLILK